MKKFFIAIVAIATALSCSNDDIISIDRQAIGFGNPFIENSTRAIDPSYGGTNLIDAFKVWGDVKGNTGTSIFLFNGADVTRGTAAYGSPFTCTQTEYWIPSSDYNFLAIANATSVTPATGAFPTAINYTADGSSDLLLSEYVAVETDAQSIPTSGVNANKCVAFTFKHLLSKVHFNFVNKSNSDKFTFKISEIKILGTYNQGTYDITSDKWTSVSDPTGEYSFGTASNATNADAENTAIAIAKDASATSHNACLIIPGEQTWKVSFECTTFYNDKEMSTDSYTGDKALTLTHTFVENGAYVINVELSAGLPIDFSVGSLGKWDSDTSITIP